MADSTSEVRRIVVQIARPKRNDPGQVCEGAYVVKDGSVVLTDLDGKPVKDASGKTYSEKVEYGNERVVATRLTKEFRSVLKRRAGPVSGFNSAIQYPKHKVI